MRKRLFLTAFILLFFGLAGTEINAKTGPVIHEKPVANKINVPPPVLFSFATLFLRVAQDYNFKLTDINNFSATWTREKNEYSVVVKFGLATCDDTAPVNELMATFKANGTIVPIPGLNGKLTDYVFHYVECIRAPF